MLRWWKHPTEEKAAIPGAGRRAVIEPMEGRVLMSATPAANTATVTIVIRPTWPQADISLLMKSPVAPAI